MKHILYLLLLTVNLNELDAQFNWVPMSFPKDTMGEIDIIHLYSSAPSVYTRDVFSGISWEYPNGGNIFTEDGQRVGSDTTEVIYVVIEEDFYESVVGNQVDTTYYPALKSFYGYHVQNWKPYSVVFYDLNWNIIQEPIHIKKRKLKSKQ